MFKEIYLHLKKCGFNVYSIGQHKGLCNEPYIVISETGDGEITGKNIMSKNIELLIYYPLERYSELEGYIKKIKGSMQELGHIRRVIEANPIVIDDDKKAYMTFLSYRIIKIKER